MSGYESIRDWAFDNYDFNKYDTFQKWLDAIESDFDLNGRGIPLRKIFDNQDYIDLENEWNERKGIDVDEDLDEELDELMEDIEELDKEEKERIEEEEERKEELKREKEEVEEKIRKDELNIFESVVESVVETVGSVVGSVVESFKGIFGRFRK